MLESIEKLKRTIKTKYGNHELPKPFAQGETIDETMEKAIVNVGELSSGGVLEWGLVSQREEQHEGGGDVYFNIVNNDFYTNPNYVYKVDIDIELGAVGDEGGVLPIINNGYEDIEYLDEMSSVGDSVSTTLFVKGWENYDGTTSYGLIDITVLLDGQGDTEMCRCSSKVYVLKYNGTPLGYTEMANLPTEE